MIEEDHVALCVGLVKMVGPQSACAGTASPRQQAEKRCRPRRPGGESEASIDADDARAMPARSRCAAPEPRVRASLAQQIPRKQCV